MQGQVNNRFREIRVTIPKTTSDELRQIAKEEGISEPAMMQRLIMLGAQKLGELRAEKDKEMAL